MGSGRKLDDDRKYDYDWVCPSTLESLRNKGEGYRDHYHEVVSHGVVWEYGCELKVPLLLYIVLFQYHIYL